MGVVLPLFGVELQGLSETEQRLLRISPTQRGLTLLELGFGVQGETRRFAFLGIALGALELEQIDLTCATVSKSFVSTFDELRTVVRPVWRPVISTLRDGAQTVEPA